VNIRRAKVINFECKIFSLALGVSLKEFNQKLRCIPSLNTQSFIKGLLVVWDFCFGAFRQPGLY
jgi:hypothetical protein